MTREDRRGWALTVKRQMEMKELFGSKVIVLAGLNYRRHLIHDLLDRFGEVDIPMSGLKMGEQLSWLSQCT
jgi:hypothetical protein